jgi:hypothetical protein
MPMFFLHYVLEDARVPDEEGHELDNVAAARREAVLGVRAIQGHRLLAGSRLSNGHVEIADAAGQTVATLSFMDVVRPHLTRPDR